MRRLASDEPARTQSLTLRDVDAAFEAIAATRGKGSQPARQARLAEVAAAALAEGRAGLARFRLAPLSPIHPMLAQPAADIDAAIEALGEAALEYKIDGARVQIDKVGSEVRIFSRRLNDVTARLPEVVEAARRVRSSSTAR